LVAIQAVGNTTTESVERARSFDVGALVLLAAACGFVVLGRRAPAVAASGVLLLTLAWYQIGYTNRLVNVPYLVAFYLLGASGDRVKQLIVGGVAVTGSAVGILTSEEPATSAAAAVGWTLAAILFGELTHSRRALVAEYEARALRAEAERDAEAERRVAQARLEIARDLHDVLAHTVSVMTVQAGVARDALARGASGTAAALDTIRAAGGDAMSEIQALVAVLRDGSRPADTAPAPRLDRLDDLAAITRAAGVDVVVRCAADGRPSPTSPS